MDLYLVLGLQPQASVGDIKRAYRRLARRYHPDVNPGDHVAAVQFRRIAQAYETLVDPVRRQRYDSGAATPDTEPTTFEFEGFDFSVSVSGASAPTFGDLFAGIFQPAQRSRPARARGADLHQTVAITFDEAMRGGRRHITITRLERCRACHGTGRLEAAQSRCGACEGSGAVKSARGHMVFSKTCTRCHGTGVQTETACRACGGRQMGVRTESVSVNIPPGVTDGAQIRIPEKGHAGPDGGAHGDLYVTISVGQHPLFRREGDHVHVTVPIAIHEAALGAKIDVPAPDGTARLRVPPGTQSGQRFRLRERGVPSPRDGRRGDLIVEVRLVIPPVLDERAKELLREFGRIHGEDVRAAVKGHNV